MFDMIKIKIKIKIKAEVGEEEEGWGGGVRNMRINDDNTQRKNKTGKKYLR